MAITISSDPTYPAPGEEVELSASGADGNVVVWALTSVPPESELALGFLLDSTDAEISSAVDVARLELEADTFEPDVAGEYGVIAYDVRRIDGLGGDGDALADTRLQLLASATATIHVGAKVDLAINTVPGDNATLRLTIVDETVRKAELVEPSTERARIAATQSSVTTPLAALVGQTVAAIGASESLETRVNNLRAQYEAHRVFTAGSVHGVPDNTNKTNRDAADSKLGAIGLLAVLSTEIVDHLQDSSTAGSRWHTSADDHKNLPLTTLGTTLASATVHLADLRERVYERHRVQTASPAVHGGSDTTNALTAPSKLDDVIVAYLDAVDAADPNAPTGESEGAQDAAARFGFRIVKPTTTST